MTTPSLAPGRIAARFVGDLRGDTRRRLVRWSAAAAAAFLALWLWSRWDLFSIPFVALVGALVALGLAISDWRDLSVTPEVMIARRERARAHAAAWAPHAGWLRARRREGTRVLLGGVTLVALAQLAGGGHSIDAAAMNAELVRQGEWWRLFTGPLLHAGAVHFWMNASALLAIGALVEAFASHRRLALVFLLAMLGGALLRTAVGSARPSVGISGGIMGLVGYLAVVAHYRGFEVAPGIRDGMVRTIWATAGLGVAGFFFIDNAGHLGGLLTGAALGWCFRHEPVGPTAPAGGATRTAERAGLAAWGVLAIAAATAVARILAAR